MRSGSDTYRSGMPVVDYVYMTCKSSFFIGNACHDTKLLGTSKNSSKHLEMQKMLILVNKVLIAMLRWSLLL